MWVGEITDGDFAQLNMNSRHKSTNFIHFENIPNKAANKCCRDTKRFMFNKHTRMCLTHQRDCADLIAPGFTAFTLKTYIMAADY